MQHRQPQARSWRLEVCDDDGRTCFELLFAAVDERLLRDPALTPRDGVVALELES